MANNPTKVKIGYHTVQIKYFDEVLKEDNEGRRRTIHACFELNKERTGYHICITNTLKGPELVETMIHEILHGIEYLEGYVTGQGNVREDQHAEYSVNTHAIGLTNVFVDNPKLLEWIRNELKRKTK